MGELASASLHAVLRQSKKINIPNFLYNHFLSALQQQVRMTLILIEHYSIFQQ